MNKLILGDCLEELKKIPDDSVDALITDPPYGIKFMGKPWDSIESMEGFFVPIWKECFRTLKSGAFAFVMSLPRSDVLSKQIIALERAGFNTKFSQIFWVTATAIPKGMNLSKKVDKKLGFKREVISKNPNTEGRYDIGISHVSAIDNLKDKPRIDFLTKHASDQAKKLDGCYAGFQPKPCIEIVIVAMKPLNYKTYIEQALAWCELENIQVGGTWLDDCRLPFVEGDKDVRRKTGGFSSKGFVYRNDPKYQIDTTKNPLPNGRFPTNILVEDKMLDDGTKTKSVKRKPSAIAPTGNSITHGDMEGILTERGFNDSGGFSRYFDLDFWFSERMKKLPKEVQKIFPFLKVPKTSKREKNSGLKHLSKKDSGSTNQNRNIHPTVKPIKLMNYLVVLATREKQIVLDPFVGSGTTAIASIMNNRKYIAIEKNSTYFDIAKERINYYTNKEE